MSQKNLVLSKKEEIKAFLRNYADGKYCNSVVEFLPETGFHLLIVPSSILGFSEKARTMLTKRIKSDISADILASQESGINDSGLMLALHELLEKLINENFIDVSASSGVHPNVRVIIFVKDIIEIEKNDIECASIRKHVTELIRPFGWSLESINYNELSSGAPSPFQIIKAIYLIAPAKFESIVGLLNSSGCPIPSEIWLRRQLDSLTRNHYACWNDGYYTLSAVGLALLPRIKGKNSPDVARALELGKRKW